MARVAEEVLEERAAAPVGVGRASEGCPAVVLWERAERKEAAGTKGAAAASEDRTEAQQVEGTAVVKREMTAERWAAQGAAEENMAATAGWEAVGERTEGVVDREAMGGRVAV